MRIHKPLGFLDCEFSYWITYHLGLSPLEPSGSFLQVPLFPAKMESRGHFLKC